MKHLRRFSEGFLGFGKSKDQKNAENDEYKNQSLNPWVEKDGKSSLKYQYQVKDSYGGDIVGYFDFESEAKDWVNNKRKKEGGNYTIQRVSRN